MGRVYNGAAVAHLATENKRHGRRFVSVPVPNQHPALKAWRNAEFLVQLYRDGEHLRLSVNRTKLAPNRQRWADGITWDQLQAIKGAVGFADRWAVEVYPPDTEVVDVANIRHLFILGGAPGYGWTGET